MKKLLLIMLVCMSTLAARADAPLRAVAVVSPLIGEAQGTVWFTQTPQGVHVVADISNLKPGSKHGFHIHEFGDITAKDGTSAGGHFNPTRSQHGSPTDASHHAGDLGNLEADSSGHAHLDMVDPSIKLEGPHSIIGRSVVIHVGEDDLHTQPTGNSGKREAIGVIGIAAAPK